MSERFKQMPRVFIISYVFVLAALAMLFCYPMPYADHFSIYMMLQDYHQNGMQAFAHYLSGTQEHWTLSVYAILLPLAIATGWSLHAETALMLVMLLLSGWCFFHAIKPSIEQVLPHKQHWKISLPLLCLIFSYTQFGNLIWGLEMFAAVALLSLYATLYFLSKVHFSWRHLFAAMLTSLFGIYGYSASFALLPMGFCMLIMRTELPRKHYISMLAAWSLFSAYILIERVKHSPDMVASASTSLLDYFIFMGYFLGGAIARFSSNLTIPMVLFGLLFVGYATVVLLRKRPHVYIAIIRPYIGLVVYATAASFFFAYGRLWEFGVKQALVARYMPFSTPMWLGIVGLLLLALYQRDYVFAKTMRRLWVAFLILSACLFTINSIQHVKKHIKLHYRIEAVKTRVLQGEATIEDEDFIFAGYRPALSFKDITDDLQKRGMGGF